MCKLRLPKTIQAIVYTRDNIHQVVNFIEQLSGKNNNTFLRYMPKQDEYYLVEYGQALEQSITKLQDGCLIIFMENKFKSIFLEVEIGGAYEKN